MSRRECATCRHFKPDQPGASGGACRRYPPQLVLEQEPTPPTYRPRPAAGSDLVAVVNSIWPRVGADEACGEWA